MTNQRHAHAAAPDTTEVHDQVAQRLANGDQRYTQSRRRLVEALAGSGRPVTLPDIIALDSDLPQSSVYRNLDVLESCGVVRRISAGTEHTYFELTEALLGHHHHLICVDCGTITDVHLDDDLEARVDAGLAHAAKAVGFTPLHHSLDLHGRCADCPLSDKVPALQEAARSEN